jgi:hypothetical protein
LSGGAKRLLTDCWIWSLVAGVSGTVAAALFIGLQDVAWPVSLSSQILGTCFVVAGLLGLVCVVLLIVNGRPVGSGKVSSVVQLAFISGGAVAALYVDLTIVAYSFRYEAGQAWLFGLLALDCASLTLFTLPATWKVITKGVKNAGITLAVLGVAANFWFQSFYLPENAQVGIEYGLSVGRVVTLGSDRLVTLHLTMDNHSPVAALIVGSMVVVSGLDYKNPRHPKHISNKRARKQAQQRARAYAISLTGRPPDKSAAVPNPNIRFSGKLKSTALTILQPVNSDSYLFPDDAYARDFDVVIPNHRIAALDVKLFVQFTRTTRLLLGPHITSAMKRYKSCPNDKKSSWYVKESALLRFTRGTQILDTYWCADLGKPFINWTVVGAGGAHDSAKAESGIASNFDVYSSSHDDIIVLH